MAGKSYGKFIFTMPKDQQQRQWRDNNSANKYTMLQQQRQSQNDDSINNNNEINMCIIICFVSKNTNRTKSYDA